MTFAKTSYRYLVFVGLGAVLFSVILIIAVCIGMQQKENESPIEKTTEIIETYLPEDDLFECYHLIDKGIYQIKTKDWILEVPFEEVELCEGKHKVELCKASAFLFHGRPLINREVFEKMSEDEQKEYMEKALFVLDKIPLVTGGTGKTRNSFD